MARPDNTRLIVAHGALICRHRAGGFPTGRVVTARRARPGWVKRLYAVLLLGVAAKLIFDIFTG